MGGPILTRITGAARDLLEHLDGGLEHVAVGILGIGSHVPDEIIGNATISDWANTNPQWIAERTGIVERRYASDGTTTSALGHAAVDNLLDRNPGALADLGAIIVATSTPDQPQPSTAVILEHELGLAGVPAFDLNAVCSGFVYALAVGNALVQQPGTAPHVLIVAADLYSSIMDRGDRRTVALFGDGAGAVLLGRVPDGFGIHASRLVAHGEHRDLVKVVGGGTRRRLDAEALAVGDDRFRMQGRAVRDYALATLPEIIQDVADEAGLGLDDIDRFVLHQANPKLLEDLAKLLGIDLGRIPLTAPRYGNTGCASIPITLCHSDAEQPLRRGERVLFAAVGGGMTAGAAVLTWY